MAVASANPTGGVAPLTVQFSSAGSNDPDGDPITFNWDFGDGTTGTGPRRSNLPAAQRHELATLTVRDNHGGVATARCTIQVGNRAAVATISAPAATLTYKVGDFLSLCGLGHRS